MASPTAATEPSAPPPAQQHLLLPHHDVAAAWPLYSPSASLTCKRGSGELQSRISDIAPESARDDDDAHPHRRALPQNGYNNDDYSHKKNEDLVVMEEIHQAEGGGGKSLPQREKDDEEDRGSRDAGAQEVVVCLRENKLKAESDLELLHTSRGTPIPTRRKKAGPSSSSAAASSPPSSLGKYSSTHINILSSNSIMTTTDGPTDLKQKQYQQFMAMAQVMKGDSFDTMEEISPPTSPRFLSLSTGSGLMSLKTQQQRYHNHISNSRNLIEGSSGGAASPSFSKSQSRHLLRSSPPVSSTSGTSSPSSPLFGLLLQRQNILFLLFIVCITSSIILLTASYSPSFNLSFRSTSSSSSHRITRPDQIDDTWFLERDRLRGRIKDHFEVDPLTEHRTLLRASDDEDYPDVPIDESYKYRDYPFLLHNALPRVAQNGTVIMVIANSGYLEFLLNWKSYVDKQGITNYVIIPSDVQLAQQLSYLGVDWAYDPEIGMDALSQSVSYTMNKGTRAWANWNKVVHKKSHYFKKIVEMGYSVMVSDIDMVWLKNPFARMNDSDVDIFFTNDGGAHGRDSSICGGLFYGKNREKSLAFINHVIECEITQEKKEQYCMNKWLGAVSGKINANVPAPETPNYKIMSIDDFPSGGYFFGDQWAGKELPYVVHNNWIVGKANKLKRFKVFGYWRVDDSSLSNLMINFRFDEHRGKPGRGREGEIADELMVYHTEMRKKFGKFDDGVWLLEKPPVPKMRAPAELQRAKKTTTSTTTTAAAAATVTSTKASVKKTDTSAPAKAGPPRKVLPPKREAARNPNYKFVDGNRNPHFSGRRCGRTDGGC